jgi:hypothetical protein
MKLGDLIKTKNNKELGVILNIVLYTYDEIPYVKILNKGRISHIDLNNVEVISENN